MKLAIAAGLFFTGLFSFMAIFPPPGGKDRFDIYSLTCKDGREWKNVEVSFSGGGFYVSRRGDLVAIIKDDCVAEKH